MAKHQQAEVVIPTGAELWCGMKIPIILLSGEVNSGKSIFPLLIDPTCRLPKDAAEPTTIVFDQEGSTETYHGSLNFKWFDTRAVVFAGFHRKVVAAGPNDPRWLKMLKEKADVNDSPAASMFRAWYLSLITIEPGKYRVGVCDTFTPLQEGMVEWLRKHPEAFGRTANQYEKASSMFLWPDVKAMLGHILTTDCRLRFETIVLNFHLKAKWEGDRKTKERIAEGLDTLGKMAALHIELNRDVDDKGAMPRTPVGILRKERLLRFGATPNDDCPILPPRIENCTPDTIRAWILAPANYSKLKVSERVVEKPVSEVELQHLRLATAEAEAEAANAKATLLAGQRELTAIRQAANATTAQTPDQTAKMREASQAKADAAVKQLQEEAIAAERRLAEQDAEGKRLAAAAEPEHAQTQQVHERAAGNVERFKSLATASGVDPVKLKAALATHGAERFTQLSAENQEALLAVLQKAANAKAGVDDTGREIPH